MRALFTIVAAIFLMAATAQANPGANGTAAMSASLFNKVFADFVPVLEQIGPDIPIGPLSGDHYSVGQFHLNNIKVSSIDVSFVAPSSIQLTIDGLDISVPSTDFSVFTHIFDEKLPKKLEPADFKISCHGKASGSASGASAIVVVDLQTTADGKLTATAQPASLTLNSIDVHLDLDGFCKIASGIIDLFHKAFDDLVLHEVKKLLPGKLQKIIQKEMNKYLPGVPLTFVSTPNVVLETLQVDIEIIPPYSSKTLLALDNKPHAPALKQSATPHIFTDRDISIGINMMSFNDIIATAAMAHGFDFNKELSGKVNTSIFEFLLPPVYKACPDCPFDLYFDIQKNFPPTVTFGQESLLFNIVNGEMNFTARSSTNHENLFSVFTNISFGVNNFTVVDNGATTNFKFDLDLQTFTLALGSSFVGPLNVEDFAKFVSGTLKDLVIPLFNAKFDGIPLNLVKDGFGLEDWKVDLNNNAITLGANIVLPSTKAKLIAASMKFAMQHGLRL